MSTTKGTILLTGANGGIGGGIASEILKSSYGITHETIYVVRDPAKADWLNGILKHAPKDHKHEIVPLGLESLDSVRLFAADINKRVANGSLPPIQAVILNAGVQDVTSKHFTKDGMERTFQVNYLADFLLVLLLLESMDKQNGRIVFVGSSTTKLDWGPNASSFTSDLQKETLITTTENMSKGIEEHPDDITYKAGMRAYAMSKLLMMMWMYELQRRLNSDPELSNIAVLGLDPGWVGATTIFRDQLIAIKIFMAIMKYVASALDHFMANPLFRTPARNGKDMLRACFDKKAFGQYPKAVYVDGSVIIPTPKWANDEVKQKELWKGSLELAKLEEGETALKDWR